MRTYTSIYKLKTKKIEKIKIVHISDIHFDIKYKNRRLDVLTREIRNVNPNYICITGDIIDNNTVLNNQKTLEVLSDFLKDLTRICKTIVTLGNHEMKGSPYTKASYDSIIKKFKNIQDLVVLDNEVYHEKGISFTGFNPSYEYYINKERDEKIFCKDFKKIKLDLLLDDYNILLVHTPKNLLKQYIYNNCNLSRFDLILSGHTHGGMMPIKMNGHHGLISPAKTLFPKNVRGHLKYDKTNLIICSAIIRLSNSAHLLRYFNDLYAMHINEITIIKSEN